MNAELYFKRSSDVAARRIGDELMIMSSRDSSLYSLNETAALLWESADGCTPLSEIVERRLCVEFEVEPATALQDAQVLLFELAERGILEVAEQGSPPGEEPGK